MPNINVTGVFEAEDDEYDSNHEMGLTNEAYERLSDALMELGFTDVSFEKGA